MLVNADEEGLARAVERLHAGGLVAFPTETVYGLGANAFRPQAVTRIFEAKQRPRFDPLICHVSELAEARGLARHWPEAAERLAQAFWPGPLTLIVEKVDAIPDLVTSGESTVGVRIPKHDVARRLLTAFGEPLAAPSANRFGGISPTTAAHVAEGLGDQALILDGGACRVGLESTIVAVFESGPPKLLRPGGLSREALERVAGPLEVPPRRAYPRASPGRLDRHYAPSTPLRLVTADRYAPSPRLGRLAFWKRPPEGYGAVEVLSARADLGEAAQRLFGALRRLDASGVNAIEAEPVPEHGLGVAIMDRLRRAQALPKPALDGSLPS